MKGLRRLWSLAGGVLVGLIVLLAIALAGVRVLGLTPYAVLSGSMEPSYPVGSLIYVKKMQPADVRVGDVITFVVNDELLVATHRVVDVEVRTTRCQAVLDENGAAVTDAAGNPIFEEIPLEEPAYYYTTKGDANRCSRFRIWAICPAGYRRGGEGRSPSALRSRCWQSRSCQRIADRRSTAQRATENSIATPEGPECSFQRREARERSSAFDTM